MEKIVKGNIETKYVVENLGDGYNSLQIVNQLTSQCPFTVPPAMQFLQPAIPSVTIGSNSADVLGSKINNVRGAVHFEMELVPGAGTDPTRNVVVVLYCLESKSAHSQASAKALPGLDLLRLGQSISTDWTAVPASYNALQYKNMPLGVAWRGFKKMFHFVKNQGTVQGDTGATGAPNTLPGGNRHSFTWRWKKDTVRYDESAGAVGSYPINYLPMFGAVAYYSDGTNTAPSGTEVGMGVNLSWRTEMYYKDA